MAVRTGSPERFTRLCRRLIDENGQDWRARLALSESGDNRETLIQAALTNFVQRHATKGGEVAIGVSGQSSFAKYSACASSVVMPSRKRMSRKQECCKHMTRRENEDATARWPARAILEWEPVLALADFDYQVHGSDIIVFTWSFGGV